MSLELMDLVRIAWDRGQVDKWVAKLDGDPGGCWLWTGKISKNGYGQVTVDGRYAYTHRVFYTIAKGEIPDGLTLDHLCRVRHCVNPSHLEPVTPAENVRRGLSGALRTHCKHGHSLHDAILLSRGERVCRQCNTMRNREGKAFRRAKKAGQA